MKRSTYALAALLLCVFVSTYGFGQSINATAGGTVSDSSKALIPGVTVTATNTGTGVAQTSVTNESGAYSFAALQPGTYKISAELPGFQTQTFTDVALGNAQQITLNFTLQVAAAAGQQVEVTVAADTVLATTSNSVGTILPEYKVRDLPALTGNTLNLVQNLPGVQRDNTGTFGYMAGGKLGDVNSTRDGINVNDGRYENGAWATVYSPPDMVEEVKVIVAPVDAETSRGSGQVQMITRSGTNQFRGSAYWTNHNSALDANDWFNNQKGVGKSFDNRNLYGARLGGPIIKNKTFFFLFFTGQRDLKKVQATSTTWTDMARAGIFRYFPNNPLGNQNATGQVPAVDLQGNPVQPPGAGALAAIGLLGSCNYNGAPVPNCKTFNDPLRNTVSTNPWLQQMFTRMPHPNSYLVGDGLNTAGINFVRVENGLDLTNGNGDEVNRDQYNARIDHNFNSREKLSVIGTQEHTWGAATQAGLRYWPNAFDGLAVKRPVVYTLQLTSTLTNSLLNQFRMGKSGSDNWQWGSANRDDATGHQALALEPVASGIPYSISGLATIANSAFNPYGGFGRWREGINPRYSIGDDLSWSHGKHAFKGGYEFRRTESNGFNDPNYTPLVTLGAGTNAVALNSTAAGGGFTGLAASDATNAANFLYDQVGQVASINQAFGVLSATNTTLQPTPAIVNNRHWNYQNEMSAYFKDDWKFRPDLTLNLGIHYEWYGMAYEAHGLAARVVGDPSAFLNVQCTGTPGTPIPDSATQPDSSCTNLAQVEFVGKNSTHPNIGSNVKGNDNNNFAPSIGLAWNVPWGGKGKTVIRTGYGMTYQGALRNFINVDGAINTVPGINLISGGSGRIYNPPSFTTLNQITLPIPLATGTPAAGPFPVPVTDRSLGITTYNYVSPYTQNWNFEIQREIAKDTTIEVRYVGTKGTKIFLGGNTNTNGGFDYNTLNWLKTDGSSALFQAFQAARAGNESPLFNQLLNGVGLQGTGVVSNGANPATCATGTPCTGAGAFRVNTTTRGYIANGNFGAFLNSLNTSLNYSGATTPDAGNILRHAGFPDNYLVPDPQFSSVTIDGNNQNSTYHALNLQITRRLSHGFTNTTTYIWSKALGNGTSPDPFHQNIKVVQNVDHTQQLSSNGTYELPFGTEHFLLGNAPGWVQNVVSKWQLGGIMNFNTGAPLSITTGIPLSTTTPTVNPITNTAGFVNVMQAFSNSTGHITKLANSVQYFNGFRQMTDPGLRQVSPVCGDPTQPTACNGLQSGYTNKAIADANGNPIFTNPQPGTPGNYGQNTLRGPRFFDLDMNLVKRFRITEGTQFEFRLDAINVLNHPNFAAPSTAIDGVGTFGQINSLVTNLVGNGMRSFIVNSRINF